MVGFNDLATCVVVGTLLLLNGAAVTASPAPVGLEFTHEFFKELIEVIQPRVNATVAAYTFPATGGHCPAVSLNAGPWIKSVGLPTSTITVSKGGTGHQKKGAAAAAVASGLKISVGNAVVTGLGDDKAWTSNTEAKYVYEGQLQFETCFQICFGSSPFRATTVFDIDVSLGNLGSSSSTGRVTAAVSFANLLHNGNWSLDAVHSNCVGSQGDFDRSFNKGMNPILNSGMPKLVKVVQDAWDAILSNTTINGFSSPAGAQIVAGATGSAGGDNNGVLLEDSGLPTPFTELPFLMSNFTKTPALKMAITTKATPLPVSTNLTTAARCIFYDRPCGDAPFGGPAFNLLFGNCSACLVKGKKAGSAMVATFAFDAKPQASSAPGLLKLNKPLKAAPTGVTSGTVKVALPILQLPVQSFEALDANAEVAAAAEAEVRDNTAGNTTVYMSTQLLSKVLASAGSKVANLLKAVKVDPLPTTALAHAPECSVSHQGFAWADVPDVVVVQASKVYRDPSTNSTRLTVQLPQLKALQGQGSFDVHCTINLPLGTPFRNFASGTFSIAQETSSGAFEFDVEVSNEGVLTVQSMPSPQFTASVAYGPQEEALLFEAYVEDLFIQTIGGSVSRRTQEILLQNTTQIWLRALHELISLVALPKKMNRASPWSSSSTTSLEFQSMNAPSTVSNSIESLISAASISSSTDAGLVCRLSVVVPPFPLGACHNLSAVCSGASSVLPAPLSATLQLQDCTSCIEARGDVVLLAVQFLAALNATSSPKFGGESTSVHSLPRTSAVHHEKYLRKRSSLRVRQAQYSGQRSEHKMSTVPHRHTSFYSQGAEVQRETALYLGTATLSQASALASSQIVSLLTKYQHTAVSSRPLPYIEQHCAVSHDSLSWAAGIPSTVSAAVTHVRSASPWDSTAPAGSVIARVELINLPATLQSSTASWNVDCEVDVDLPVNFKQTRSGAAQATVHFAASQEKPVFSIDLLLSVGGGTGETEGAGRTLQVMSHNISAFTLSSSYTYHDSDSFAFDPYMNHYWKQTVLAEIQSELTDLMLHQAGSLIAREVVSFLSASQSGAACNLTTFNETHVIVRTGAGCGQRLPTLLPMGTSQLANDQLMYYVDAGVFPPAANVTPQQVSAQAISSSCTSLVPLTGVLNTSSSVAISDCQTVGTQYQQRLIISTIGKLTL